MPRVEGVLAHHGEQRVRGRMRVAAGGVELERGLGQRPARAERSISRAGSASLDMPAARPCGPSRMRRAPVKPSAASQAAVNPAAAACAVCSCLDRQRRAGTPQARRLRAGRAEGMQHLRRRQPEQPADRRRSRQRAGRARGVEDLVVRAAEELADADAHLVADDRGGSSSRAAATERLRRRERRREHHAARVEHRAVVHVVLLGEVRRCRVDHRGQQRAGAPAVIRISHGPSAGPCSRQSAPSSRPGARPCRRAPSRTSRETGPRRGAAPPERRRSAAWRRRRRAPPRARPRAGRFRARLTSSQRPRQPQR